MLIKVYMTAQLWLHSDVVFPYLVTIGQQEPMHRKHAFMLMKPSETGDNEKSFGEPGYYESKNRIVDQYFRGIKTHKRQLDGLLRTAKTMGCIGFNI